MCGIHDGEIWICNADWMTGRAFVDNGSRDSAEVGCAAAVGDGEGVRWWSTRRGDLREW
jgi:hypothetical protein